MLRGVGRRKVHGFHRIHRFERFRAIGRYQGYIYRGDMVIAPATQVLSVFSEDHDSRRPCVLADIHLSVMIPVVTINHQTHKQSNNRGVIITSDCYRFREGLFRGVLRKRRQVTLKL